MREIKYIINDINCVIIFDAFFIHADMAKGKDIISAGFINFFDGRFQCYGESMSLGIKSRPEEDSRIINTLFGLDD